MTGSGKSAIVIGGGLAGLSAAWRLSRSGCDVKVLEKLERVGGRFGGERALGFSIDRSVPLLLTGDRHLLSWVEELGIRDRVLPPRVLQIGQHDRGRTVPVRGESTLAAFRLPGVRWWQAGRMFRLARLLQRYRPLLDPDAPEKAADLDFRSVADFASLYFGRSVLENWVAPAVTAVSGGEVSEMSRVAYLLQLEEQRHGVNAIPRAGLQEVARVAADRVSMRYGFEVTSIEPRQGGGFRVHALRQNASDETLEADAVVFAGSVKGLTDMATGCLSLPEKDFFGQVRFADTNVLSIAHSRPPAGVPEFVRFAPASSSSIESVLLEPGAAGERVPDGAGLAVVTAREPFAAKHSSSSDDVVEKELLAAYEGMGSPRSPEIRFARLHRGEAERPRFDVGHYRNLARFRKVQRDLRAGGRRLYFAGDYLVGSRPEHAVASGMRAARNLISDWG